MGTAQHALQATAPSVLVAGVVLHLCVVGG